MNPGGAKTAKPRYGSQGPLKASRDLIALTQDNQNLGHRRALSAAKREP